MRKIKIVWKAALLIAGAALMTILLWLVGTMFLVVSSYIKNADSFLVVKTISDALISVENDYVFSESDRLNEHGAWAMLISESGNVIWSCGKPSDVQEHYGITDVASFSKWYLKDYPVQSWIREDGLFVLGMPQFGTWKYNVEIENTQLSNMFVWTVVMLVLSLLCVIGLSALLLKHWFKKEQMLRDAARADWINGVSHDIRTPLSLVMGYSSQLSQNECLPIEARKQANIILSQSQIIKELVGDLNLTMRLSYNMEPLRKEYIDPIALMRQAAADLMNSGLDECYTLELDIPQNTDDTFFVDAVLIKRALKNLLNNCVKHNKFGCTILLKADKSDDYWKFTVESRGTEPVIAAESENEGAHGEIELGTGLKLVRQIAAVHSGSAKFNIVGNCFICEMKIPSTGKKLKVK